MVEGLKGVPVSLEYSAGAVMEFMDYMAEKGLANKNTATSRKAACSKMFSILDSAEASDVRNLDVDELAARFNNLKGTKYSPKSLQVYKSRVARALQDFLAFKADPANFKPAAAQSQKSKTSNKSQDSSQTSVRGSLGRTAHVVPDAGVMGVVGNVRTIDIPIALRPDHVIVLSGLPVDLSSSEAEKISAVVKAMALV